MPEKAQPAAAVEDEQASERGDSRMAFWLFGFSGMAALIYEVVWTRALSLVLGSSTYALSTMLASFMSGLSIGALIGGRLADRSRRTVMLFALLEAGIAVTGLFAVPLINLLPPLYAKLYYLFKQSFSSFSVIQFLLCFMIMLVPTTLMGATFPVLCKINYRGEGKIGTETGGVYAINTIGAIAGALMAGFMLIPNMGVRGANTVAAFINISIVVALLFRHMHGSERWKNIGKACLAFVMTLFLSGLMWANAAYPSGFYNVWKFSSYDDYSKFINQRLPLLFNKDDVSGNVRVFQVADGNAIYINGRTESHSAGDLLNTSLLAYLPASLRPDAGSFLSIGLGTGNTIHFASTLPGLKEIYSVEISPAVEEAVRLHFYPGLFEDRRVRFVTADARNYLMLVEKKYDIISSEPSYPVDQGFSHLFSREFYQLVRSRLNNNGVFCQWVPTYLFTEDEMKMILATFATVFPNTTVWGVKEVEILFVGAAGDSEQPVDEMKRRADAWLEERGIRPEYALYLNAYGVNDVRKAYRGRLNTDDMPVLEFYAARNMLVR